jgi:hypothetical protein
MGKKELVEKMRDVINKPTFYPVTMVIWLIITVALIVYGIVSGDFRKCNC